jgi:hypothetical protein
MHQAPIGVETMEVRHFETHLRGSAIAIRRAVERAARLRLFPEARGMWRGERPARLGDRLELTVRASETTEGTQIVLLARHRTPPLALLARVLLLTPLVFLVVPLVALAVVTYRHQELQRREREVLVHGVWAELAERLGAPQRATYREAPTRVLPDEIERASGRPGRALRASSADGWYERC